MIRPLRGRHRMAFVVLAIVVVPLFVAGLRVRGPVPPEGATVSGEIDPGNVVVGVGDTLTHDGFTLDATVIRQPTASSGYAVALDFRPEAERPDLLVYWQAGDAGELNDDALLLGRLASYRPVVLDLPVAAVTGNGKLILYSLAHRQLVAALEVPALETEARG